MAQSQGQKIFTITQANAAQVIPKLQHRGSVIDEVSSAVAAGKEVTIHEKAITESGWAGAGYTVIDPETGAGGYFSLLGVAVAMPGEQLMSMGILAILVGEKWGSWIYVIALCIALSCALLVQASTREAVSDIHYMRYVGTFGREKAFEPTMLNKLEKNIFSAIPIYCLTLPFLMSWMF